MNIYRITFHMPLLVEAATEAEAVCIATKHLGDEVNNYSSTDYDIDQIQATYQLRRMERKSLPWRSDDRRNESEMTVDKLLEAKNG